MAVNNVITLENGKQYAPLFDGNVQDPEIQTRIRTWIAALRDGKYQQASGTLKTHDDRFCCLGVLCDLVDPTAWDNEVSPIWIWKDQPQDLATSNRYGGLPPQPLMQKLYDMPNGAKFGDLVKSVGLGETTEYLPGSLDLMNDNHKTFSEIADTIERELNEALARLSADAGGPGVEDEKGESTPTS